MKRHTRWFALVGAVALLAAACGGDDGDSGSDGGDTAATDGATGATGTAAGGGAGEAASGEAVPVGALFDLSGATADVGTPFAEGVRAYVEWRNANGGVDGRPIELMSQDYAYDVAQAEQLYSQYTSEGAVAISGWGTADTEALRQQITNDEIPFISASYAATLIDPAETPYNFVVATTYSQQMRIALDYLAEQAGGEQLSVAVFHNDSPFGESPLEDGRSYIEEQGLAIDYQTVAMPGGATDYFGELSQAGDVDYVIVQNVSSPAAQLANDMQSQGMDATLVCLNWCGDELYVELAGGAAEGSLGVLPWAPPEQAEDLSDVTGYLEQQGQSIDDINLHFTQGWYQFHVLAEGIEQALTSGEELSGSAIKTGMEEMEPVETPVSEPIEFSADDHAGMKSARVYEVQDGQWTAVSDAISP